METENKNECRDATEFNIEKEELQFLKECLESLCRIEYNNQQIENEKKNIKGNKV